MTTINSIRVKPFALFMFAICLHGLGSDGF
jgi:hypothetical protein